MLLLQIGVIVSSLGLAPEIWTLPPPGLAKLSTDAAIYLSNNKSGLPRILRNSNGDTITALAIPYPRTGQPQIQEAKALILSLKWFLSEEFPIHFTEMDCKNIIDALNSLPDSASIFRHLIALCRGTKISHLMTACLPLLHSVLNKQSPPFDVSISPAAMLVIDFYLLSESSKKWKAWYESHRPRPCEHTPSGAHPYDEEEEQAYNSYYSHDDYSRKPEYDYNPLYEWNCEEKDPWASMLINCEMMKDLLAELKQIKHELSKFSSHLVSSHVNSFPPQPVNEALISTATFHNFDKVSVTSTYSGENFEESTLPSTNEGYHTDVVPTLFIEEDDTTTILNEAFSHSTILPLILDEKKCYHTDVIDKVIEEIRKLFSFNHLSYFLYDLDKAHFLFPENVTNASIFETQDKRKFIFDTR
ncbi:hypothetical protein F8388_017537 [Cannabis sativa]|uniref:RNase H type-1 domain-containing protein n=1 Tax=Cannabis sativa TaxID=3483 RepID=A0A7J6G2A5_CANSA|nr:hypothetical protein F8388_017537 [Cannabis sativa]